MTPYTVDDFDALADWLADSALPDGALSIEALEGYLVAVATHAPTLRPDQWLPPIWGYPPGSRIDVEPRHGSRERLLGLVLALHSEWMQAKRGKHGATGGRPVPIELADRIGTKLS
jgi:Uncharacterised protein family (UPF0149)